MTIELGLALKAFNLVTKFERKRFTFVAVIARKRSVTDGHTDGRTDKPKLITPLFFFEKAGDNKTEEFITVSKTKSRKLKKITLSQENSLFILFLHIDTSAADDF